MTGRRILDVAAVFKAARGVASKHVASRAHQLGVFSKTSTLAKAVQSQTDRVTLTVKAASALANRFNGPAPQYPTRASKPVTTPKNSPIPNGVEIEVVSEGTKEVDESTKNHLYKRSEENTTAEPLVADRLNVKQEEANRHPFSNESVRPTGAVVNASAREGEASSKTPKEVIEPSDKEKQRREPSPLRRMQVPNKIEDSHQNHDLVADNQTNQDVLYSSDPTNHEQAVPEGQAAPEQDQPSSEAFSEIFHSPRVARMLGGQPKRGAPSGGLELPGAKGTPAEESKPLRGSDRVSSSIGTPAPTIHGAPSSLVESSETTTAKKRGKEDVHALAAEMAKDAENIPSDASGVSLET